MAKSRQNRPNSPVERSTIARLILAVGHNSAFIRPLSTLQTIHMADGEPMARFTDGSLRHMASKEARRQAHDHQRKLIQKANYFDQNKGIV